MPERSRLGIIVLIEIGTALSFLRAFSMTYGMLDGRSRY
jgi:hypothetical protein